MNNSYTSTQGFTLIELLVVVLIIGILSAVALPQYNQAVLKARLSRIMPSVRSIKNAAETYYMVNGDYPDDISVLDVGEISGCNAATGTAGHMHCSDFWIDIKSGLLTRAMYAVVGFGGKFGSGNIPLAYAIYFDNSDYSGRVECWAHSPNSAANSVCKSLGGIYLEKRAHGSTANMDSPINIYSLP